MKTVYWPEEGDEAEEWPLCERCYEVVSEEVSDRKPGGGHGAWVGTCVDCAG
jgi:hypothetical protein